jgi:hypothetical protein
MSNQGSFGRQLFDAGGPDSLYDLERSADKSKGFQELDSLVQGVLELSLVGERVILLERNRQSDRLSIPALAANLVPVLEASFTLAKQQFSGAWFLPDTASLKSGLPNLPWNIAHYPRFATGITWEERARISLEDGAPAVFVWAVLEPLFEQLYLPIELRGHLSGMKSREERLAAWRSASELLMAMAINVGNEFEAIRFGGGWSRLSAVEQLETKRQYLTTLSSHLLPEAAARYRLYKIAPLVERYYKVARDGRAKRSRVLTRALERTLAGFFVGDWLKFLDYIGEQPHPDEEIATVLPKPRLFVADATNVSSVAEDLGLPAEEVRRVVATYFDGDGGIATASPISARTDALKTYWSQFNLLHSTQEPGSRSLWGLVEESRRVWADANGPDWFHPELYRELLPQELIDKIDALWGGIMLPRWPDRIVSEISPHGLMAEALGPALKFWQGAALTAWFVCEGPMSRTTLGGLESYFQNELTKLAEGNCPIDASLFKELREAEMRLGPPQPMQGNERRTEITPGLSVGITINLGTRRGGFPMVRDIISKHRTRWTEQLFDKYLLSLWQSELRGAAEDFARVVANRGKVPTARQYSADASQVVCHWFGGDLRELYGAIGEKCDVHPRRLNLMPKSRRSFVEDVFRRLGGVPFRQSSSNGSPEEIVEQSEQRERHGMLTWLASESLTFVQLHEALGRPPDVREFGSSRFSYRSTALSSDLQEAWSRYSDVVNDARAWSADSARQEPLAPETVNASKPESAEATTAVISDSVSTGSQNIGPRPWWARLFGR